MEEACLRGLDIEKATDNKSNCNMIEKVGLIFDLLDFSFKRGVLTHV